MADLKLCQLIHAGSDGFRNIISLNGMPFYLSTGINSAYPGTWFPFLGIAEEDIDWLNPKGRYIKFSYHSIPKEVDELMDKLFPSYGGHNAGRQLLLRFHNLPCLILSSCLGGGLWKKGEGQKLKQYLKTNYTEYYQNIPELTLLPEEEQLKTSKQINCWLCKQAQVDKIFDLKTKFPADLENFSKPVPKSSKKSTFFNRCTNLKNILLNSTAMQLILWGILAGLIYYRMTLSIPFFILMSGFYSYQLYQKWHQYHVNQAKKVFSNDWLDKNNKAYHLGYQAKTWLPFCQSYLNKEGYSNIRAFHLGLQDALENRPLRIKIH